jgi:hypothetical protein
MIALVFVIVPNFKTFNILFFFLQKAFFGISNLVRH